MLSGFYLRHFRPVTAAACLIFVCEAVRTHSLHCKTGFTHEGTCIPGHLYTLLCNRSVKTGLNRRNNAGPNFGIFHSLSYGNISRRALFYHTVRDPSFSDRRSCQSIQDLFLPVKNENSLSRVFEILCKCILSRAIKFPCVRSFQSNFTNLFEFIRAFLLSSRKP